MTRVETAVNRPYVPPEGTTITATVDIHPGVQAEPVERHIALVIDTSGSMTGEKIARARDGVRWVFGLLEPGDYVTVVGFDSEAELVVRPTGWAEVEHEMIEGQVADLTAGGGTNMFAGLERAQAALESIEARGETGTQTPVRRILVLSDGKDRHHDPSDFRDLAVDVDEAGIRVEAAGIGEDYNQETIRTLGRTARGEWAHLEGPGDTETFFGDAVEQAGTVVAPDARLVIDTSADVDIDDVCRAVPQAHDVTPAWQGDEATVKLPGLAEREHQTELVAEGGLDERHRATKLVSEVQGVQTDDS